MNATLNRALFTLQNAPGAAGNLMIGAAVTGPFRTLGAAQDGKTFDGVCLVEGDAWEVRNGCTYTHSTGTLTRGVLEDSSTGAPVAFTAAAQVMLIGMTAAKLARMDSLVSGAVKLEPGTTLAVAQANLATLNAALAQGGYVRLATDGVISGRLVIPSNTVFDCTGKALTLIDGVNTNMAVSYAYANPVAVGTADATSGSNVINTALGAQAVVGQTIVLVGAGAGGTGPLVANIRSRTSTTITLEKQNGTDAPASATVTAGVCKLITRDTNISIIGGRWNRGANGPNSGTGVPQSATPGHSILMEHVDGLTVDIERCDSTAGVTFVWITDCTDFNASVRGGQVVRTIMQIVGPVRNGRIPYVRGGCNDDLINICGNVYTDQTDTSGDVDGIKVGTIQADGVGGSALKFNAGVGCTIDGVEVGHISGTANVGLFMGDDYAYAATTGGTYGTFRIGYLGTNGFGANPKSIYFFTPALKSLTVEDGVLLPFDPVWIQGTSAVAVEHLSLKFSVVSTVKSWLIRVFQSAVIKSLQLNGCQINLSTTESSVVRVYGTAVVDQIVGDRCRVVLGGTGSTGIYVYETGTVRDAKWRDSIFEYSSNTSTAFPIYGGAGTLTKSTIEGGVYTSPAALVRVDSGVTASSIHIGGGVTVTTPDRLVNMRNAACDLHIGEVRCTTPGNVMVITNNAAGVYNIYGQNIACNTATAKVGRTVGTETINVYAPTLEVDLNILPKTAGQQARNTNATLVSSTFGLGPAVANGTAWKNLYTGITF